MSGKQIEQVPFRLIEMPCCGQQLCWINPRFPLYCPECGTYVYTKVRTGVIASDPTAILETHIEPWDEVISP